MQGPPRARPGTSQRRGLSGFWTRGWARAMGLLGQVTALTCLVLLAVPRPAGAATADPLATLAAKYAPIVVVREQAKACGDGEPYRPTSVATVLGKSDVLLRGPNGETLGAPTAADLAGKGSDWYLDYPGNPLDPGCTYESWFQTASAGTQPTLYARLASDPSHPDKVALQYWFFYTFNDWNDKHEGDWEMVQVVFPATSAQQALTATPESVAFAQHEGSQVSPWEGGDLIRVGDRPVVYPGQGSHAAYFTQAVWFGKSAAAGFGCDDTTAPGTQVEPRIEVIPSGPAPTTGPFAWLSYAGHWGQQERSFNNGPTGPTTKDQWSSPIAWQVAEGRSSAVSLPPVPSSALKAFCSLTASGSALFNDLLDQPVVVIAVLLLLLVVVIVAIRNTRWRHSDPARPDRGRRAGQIVVAAFGWVALSIRQVAVISAVIAGVTVGSQAIRAILLAPRVTTDITDVQGSDGRWFSQLVVLGIALVSLALIGWTSAGIISLVQDDSQGRGAGPGKALRAGWQQRPAIGAAVVLITAAGLLAASLVLLPVAGYLVARWAVAPAAAVVEGLGTRAAFRRSSELTRGLRWRTLGVQSGLMGIGMLTPGLVGAVLLLITSWPFWVSGLITAALLSLLLPVAFVGTAMHYYDLVQRCAGRLAPEAAAASQMPTA